MCAYITGIVGECGVGAKQQGHALEELSKESLLEFEDIVMQVADEDGCERPVEIVPNTGWFNDGMGAHWRVDDTNIEAQLSTYCESIKKYCEPEIERYKLYLTKLEAGEPISNWTVEGLDRSIKELEGRIQTACDLKEISRWPAYMSVGIWLYSRPSDDLIDLMKLRAQDFADEKGIQIEGFRMSKTVTEEVL